MKINHIALWVRDLEQMKAFYDKYFLIKSNELYNNEKKGLKTYILSFKDGCRIEIMQIPEMQLLEKKDIRNYEGYCHISVSVGSEQEVKRLTDTLRNDGFPVLDGPRWTGEGYFESVILDPENNRIELTV